MTRCRKLGYRGVVITTWPSGEDDLSSEDDRFFAAAFLVFAFFALAFVA